MQRSLDTFKAVSLLFYDHIVALVNVDLSHAVKYKAVTIMRREEPLAITMGFEFEAECGCYASHYKSGPFPSSHMPS